MTTTTLVNGVATLVAAATSNAAGATTRGTVDMRGKQGGLLTMKITNGATGPTLQAECRILVAHDTGTTPTAASAGAVWKTLWVFGGGTVANAITEQNVWLNPACHYEIEFTGNTGQAVTVESFISNLDSASSV